MLALEYAHIADSTGRALVILYPILKRPHFRLQNYCPIRPGRNIGSRRRPSTTYYAWEFKHREIPVFRLLLEIDKSKNSPKFTILRAVDAYIPLDLMLICREDQTPGQTDAALGVGGHVVPDRAWRRITFGCPDLIITMVFFRVHDYDNLRRFLTPSIPIREAHLQIGIDLAQTRQQSDISCFIRHMAYRYSHSLNVLSIHQWRSEELPMYRLLELMPFLVRFIFVGRVSEEQLEAALTFVACGVCKNLQQIVIQVEDVVENHKYWSDLVNNLMNKYQSILDVLDTELCIVVYKH